MAKTYIRVDDRLIHGQITVAWGQLLSIGEIIAIDDQTASNPILKSIMTMAVPKTYNAKIVTTKEALELFSKPFDKNRLVIIRKPSTLPEIITHIGEAETLYLGNIGKTPESKYNLSLGAGGVLFFSESDIEILDNLDNEGYKIILQMVPTSSLRTWDRAKKAFGK